MKLLKANLRTCNFSEPLQKLGSLPLPGEGESDGDYALDLQDWSIDAFEANRSNVILRNYTSDCISLYLGDSND